MLDILVNGEDDIEPLTSFLQEFPILQPFPSNFTRRFDRMIGESIFEAPG